MNDQLGSESLKDVRIFVVDDEKVLAWSIDNQLRSLGAEVEVAASVAEAKAKFSEFQPDLAICDLRLPDGNGMDLLKAWHAHQPNLPVILITAHGAVDSAVAAVRLGAFDYLQKPFDMKNLLAAVGRASEVSQLRQKVSRQEGPLTGKAPVHIIGETAAIKKIRRQLHRLARSKTDTIMIQGETGSGKELAARAVHEWSDHAEQPYLEINCASIPENLLESELFGYEKGAFTDARSRKLGLFEIAKGGTIFLDEIGELPLKLQSKLLRVLEYRRFKRLGGTKDIEFKARVVAATNRDLVTEVQNARFRADLFYRLNVIPIAVPPLRDHPEDIEMLAKFLIAKIASDLESPQPKLSAAAIQTLKQHDWPGNVRELRNLLQRVMVLENPPTIKDTHLEFDPALTKAPSPEPTAMTALPPVNPSSDATSSGITLPRGGIPLEAVEKSLLVQALERCHYNQSKAAELLDISRHTLRYRLEKYGIADH